MSRKITTQAIDCLMNASNFQGGNTKVLANANVTIMYLHNNPIAYLYNDPERTLSITNSGWQSNTTKERLSGIPGVSISQKKGIWYLNGNLWDGGLIDIN